RTAYEIFTGLEFRRVLFRSDLRGPGRGARSFAAAQDCNGADQVSFLRQLPRWRGDLSKPVALTSRAFLRPVRRPNDLGQKWLSRSEERRVGKACRCRGSPGR